MEIVRFKDGKYAIRKRNGTSSVFCSMQRSIYWWPKRKEYEKWYTTSSLETVKKRFIEIEKMEKELLKEKQIKFNFERDMGNPINMSSKLKIKDLFSKFPSIQKIFLD
jgi:hypothetical protein